MYKSTLCFFFPVLNSQMYTSVTSALKNLHCDSDNVEVDVEFGN